MQPDPVGARSTAVVEGACDGDASGGAALSGEMENEGIFLDLYQLFLPFLPLEKRMKTLERKKSGKKME